MFCLNNVTAYKLIEVYEQQDLLVYQWTELWSHRLWGCFAVLWSLWSFSTCVFCEKHFCRAVTPPKSFIVESGTTSTLGLKSVLDSLIFTLEGNNQQKWTILKVNVSCVKNASSNSHLFFFFLTKLDIFVTLCFPNKLSYPMSCFSQQTRNYQYLWLLRRLSASGIAWRVQKRIWCK